MATAATTTATDAGAEASGARNRLNSVHIFDTIEDPAVLRELIVDDIYLLGGQFAILCQFAHPGIARGTVGHSTFASRIPERLRNTARFLNASVFGTEREKRAIFSVIHKYHARVHGEVGGTRYDANDPELHLWTAATLFVSLVVVHEALFGKLGRARTEAMYRESAVFGTSLRMPPEMWPKTLDDFWAYWDHMIATLEVTPEAKKLSRELLWPKNLPWNMQVLIPLSRVVTKQLLPPRLRREYDLEPSTLDWIQYQAAVSGLSYLYPYLPASLRSRRHNMYMEDLKAAVARVEKTGHWGRDRDYPA